MPAGRTGGGRFRRLDRRDVFLRRHQTPAAGRASDGMLDERQRRYPIPRPRIHPSLQSLSAHEDDHARQHPPCIGDDAASGHDRRKCRNARASRGRTNAGRNMTVLHDMVGAPVIIGGGLAGLMTALALAPQPVLLLTSAPLGLESSSVLAQGGIAASIGADDDASLHLEDTLIAGDGLCDETVAAAILAAAPAAIEQLERLGVVFDRDASDAIALGREAAHSRRRIVHAGGDATGRDIIRALSRRVYETPSITVMEATTAQRLVVEDNAMTGLLCNTARGPVLFATDRVVIATGGIGGLFLHGTNPAGSFGQGLTLAACAGALLADLEFIQFHPTALDAPGSRLSLISEAVRGEGAILIDETGMRFMTDTPRAELAARDVLARGVWRHINDGHQIFLDASKSKNLDFAARFPAITALCRAAGIDPRKEPIPVRPAAHYHMGGINVDLEGRSSVDGLWACGEVACTGLHGANRLASNSLLEAVVCAGFTAAS